ncbi:hypothetical protein AO268_08990 [Pseudomonas sp. ICMP 8385]|nr:hypothetical protein AO268_08990 [Pseudomonas sp. ICMP 8385]
MVGMSKDAFIRLVLHRLQYFGEHVCCSAVFCCVCTRIHLWTRFALRLWLSAMLAIEAPGWTHS